MADIFDEVSEELRQDQFVKLLKKYSKYIITLLIIVILSVGSYQGYLIWNKNKIEQSSEQFFLALEKLNNNNFEQSAKDFSNNSLKYSNGYKVLSIFGLAQSNFKNKNISDMILNYKSIYEDDNIDNYYRELARMLSVMKDNISSYQKLKNRLQPILTSPSDFQALAAELQIILLIRFDKVDEALENLNKILKRSDLSIEQINRLSLINKVYDSYAK